MSTTTVDPLAEQLDRQLIDALTYGQVIVGPDGAAMLGPDGKPLRRPCSAALLNAARQRCKDRRRESPDKYRETGEVERIMRDIHGDGAEE